MDHKCFCFQVFFPLDCCAHGGAKDRTVLRAIRQMHREVQLLLVVVVVIAIVVLQRLPRRKHTIQFQDLYTTHDLIIIMKTIQDLLNGNGWHHLQELQCKEVEFSEFNEHTFDQPGQGLPGTMVPTFEGGGAEDL